MSAETARGFRGAGHAPGALTRPSRSLRRRLRFLARHGPGFLSRAPSRPLAGRLLDILRGFDPAEADWYRQVRGDLRGVLSNYNRETHLHGLNRHHASVLDDKAVFAAAMRDAGLPTPEVFALFTRGRWHERPGGRAALERHRAATGRFVIKPTMGSKGRSILVGRTEADIDGYRGEDAILTAFVEQAPYAQAIFPGALNTLRLLMLRDGAGEPRLAAAVHRFGTARTGAVDNFSTGGLVATVDRESGILGQAAQIDEANRIVFSDAHPDTGAAIRGVAVPGWGEVLALVQALGAAFPSLVYVGWDIAVTAEGPTVIEGNAHPSLRSFQLTERLLENPALRPIFALYVPDLHRRAG